MKNKDWDEEKDVMFRKLAHERKGLRSKDWLKDIPVKYDTFHRRKKELQTQKYVFKKGLNFQLNITEEFKNLYDNFSIDVKKAEKEIKKIPHLQRGEIFGEAYYWIILLLTLKNKFDFYKLIGEFDLPADEKFYDYSLSEINSLIKNLLEELHERDFELTSSIIQTISKRRIGYVPY